MNGGARLGERHQIVEALFIRDHFWRWLARFELGAHFLNLSGLLFHNCYKSFDFLLLLKVVRFQFLNFPVLFEELIEQHRVHRIIAHSPKLTVLAVYDQIAIYLLYVFRNQTKLRCQVVFTSRFL
jgi:hypothetical protein